MAYYQCFKTREREVYCSSYKVRNHDEGREWVTNTMAHFGINGSDLLGKPFERDSQPDGAIIFPAMMQESTEEENTG